MLKKYTILSLTLLIAFFSLSGCFEGEGDSFELVNLQNVLIECPDASATNCAAGAANGKTVHVGWLKGTGINCESFFLNPSVDFLINFEAYATTTVSYDSGIFAMTGTVSNWARQSGPVDVLENTAHTICAFIDINGNEELDSNEPVGQEEGYPGTADIELNSWFDPIL